MYRVYLRSPVAQSKTSGETLPAYGIRILLYVGSELMKEWIFMRISLCVNFENISNTRQGQYKDIVKHLNPVFRESK